MRALRKFLEVFLPVSGGIVLLHSAIVHTVGPYQIMIFTLGFLTIVVGTSGLFHRMLPNDRRYLPLRMEVDRFLGLVRELNATALIIQQDPSSSHRQAFEAIKADMHKSVEQMSWVAGKEETFPPESHQEQDDGADQDSDEVTHVASSSSTSS